VIKKTIWQTTDSENVRITRAGIIIVGAPSGGVDNWAQEEKGKLSNVTRTRIPSTPGAIQTVNSYRALCCFRPRKRNQEQKQSTGRKRKRRSSQQYMA